MSCVYRKTLFVLSVALLITCMSTSSTFAQSKSWTIVSSPSKGPLGNNLFGVATVSASDVWAVGDYNDGPYTRAARTLAEHWNGSNWQIVKTPNPATSGQDYDRLQAVAAVSTNDVWAVGYYDNNNGFNTYTLIEHWNGSAWSVVKSPNPTVSQYLYSVAVISASDIRAVGFFSDQRSQQGTGSLTLHWDGTTWSQVSNPGKTALYGVTAVASNNVWAVAGYTLQKHQYGPLILHWDGARWNIVPSHGSGTLTAVVAVSANDIWAVGYELYVYYYHTVTEHWNGKTWSQVPSPDPSSWANGFYGVTALSATSVWAVGFTSGEPLVEKWNGTRWTVVPTANVNTFDTFQAAASISTTGGVWAVGYSLQNSRLARTLIEQCRAC